MVGAEPMLPAAAGDTPADLAAWLAGINSEIRLPEGDPFIAVLGEEAAAEARRADALRALGVENL